jgi:hypothetical protein
VQFFNKIGKFDQKKIHSGSGPKNLVINIFE